MELTLDDLASDPHPHWHRLRAQAPVSRVPALGGWVVTGYSAAAAVLRDASTFTVDDPRFSTAQVFGPSMLSLDGPEHARHRAPFAAAFRPAEVRAAFTEYVSNEVERLLDLADRDGRFEIRTGLAAPLAASVMCSLLGLAASPEQLLAWYAELVGGVNAITAGGAAGAAALSAHDRLRAEVAAAGRFLGGGLSVDESVANAGILTFGGIETTEGMIANAAWHLLTAPSWLAEVVADPALLDAVIEESLRLEPAASRVDRYTTSDTVVEGAKIPAGELVIVSLAAANRDPVVFADPDSFDPSRRNASKHLSLAIGPHYCLGAHLTRLETRTALAAMLRRWPSMRLEASASAEPYGLVFRKPPAVVITW